MFWKKKVLDQPLDQIGIDEQIFGRLEHARVTGRTTTAAGLADVLNDVVSTVQVPPNVQTSGRVFMADLHYVIQFESVTLLRVALPGYHSGTAKQLGTGRLRIPMLLASTLTAQVGLQDFHYNASFTGHAAVDGVNVLMAKDTMAGPSRDNTTVQLLVDLGSNTDDHAASAANDIISSAIINASMAAPRHTLHTPNTNGLTPQVHVSFDDTVRSSDASDYCRQHPTASDLSTDTCLDQQRPDQRATVRYRIFNGRSVPVNYLSMLLEHGLVSMTENLLRSPAAVPVGPLGQSLHELSGQTRALLERTMWLDMPGTLDEQTLATTKQAVCPGQVPTTTTYVFTINNRTSYQCTVALDGASIEAVVKSVNAGLAECNLASVVFVRLKKLEYSEARKEQCGILSLVTQAVQGAIWSWQVATPAATGGPVWNHQLTVQRVPVFVALEDAGRVSDAFYGAATQPAGRSSWELCQLHGNFRPGDLVPHDLLVVVPLRVPVWLYSGTHLTHVDQVQSPVAASILADGAHVEPANPPAASLEMLHDTSLTYGVAFEVPRLDGVSPHDTRPWYTMTTVCKNNCTIYNRVTLDNSTFHLSLAAQDRTCLDYQPDAGCADLQVAPVNLELDLVLQVGQRLNDTFLRDLPSQIPEPWRQMLTFVLVPADPRLPGATDQLAIRVRGLPLDSSPSLRWRIPVTVGVHAASAVDVNRRAGANDDPARPIGFIHNFTYAPPQARVILANVSVAVSGSVNASFAGPGGIGIVPVHGSNIAAGTRFAFQAQQKLPRASMEQMLGRLFAGDRMFEVYQAGAAVSGIIVFPDEHLDVLEIGFHGDTGMRFTLDVRAPNMTTLADAQAMAATNVYHTTFVGPLTQLMTRLSRTTRADLCTMVADVARLDAELLALPEARTPLPLTAKSFGQLYRAAFASPLAQLEQRVCNRSDILDVRMLCDHFAAVYGQPVCATPRLNAVTHTFEIPFAWSVANLRVPDALQLDANELFDENTGFATFPLLEGSPGQMHVVYNASVGFTLHLDFSDPTRDVIEVRAFAANMSANFDLSGNQEVWFGPVSLWLEDTKSWLLADVQVAQAAAARPLSVTATAINASIITTLDFRRAPFCYVHVHAAPSYLADGGFRPSDLTQLTCGSGGLAGELEETLQEHSFHKYMSSTPHRFVQQLAQSVQSLHSGVVFGAAGVLPQGLNMPLLGSHLELELRKELTNVLPPGLQKQIAADLAQLAHINGSQTRHELAQLVVDDVTQLVCQWFAPIMLGNCPKAPTLSPATDNVNTCLDGDCVWPARLGRRYVHQVSHLSNDMAGDGKMHFASADVSESIDVIIEWELRVDLVYSDRHGFAFQFPYSPALNFTAALDLDLLLAGQLGVIGADMNLDGQLQFSLVLNPPRPVDQHYHHEDGKKSGRRARRDDDASGAAPTGAMAGTAGASGTWEWKLARIFGGILNGMLQECWAVAIADDCIDHLHEYFETLANDMEKTIHDADAAANVSLVHNRTATMGYVYGQPLPFGNAQPSDASVEAWLHMIGARLAVFRDALRLILDALLGGLKAEVECIDWGKTAVNVIEKLVGSIHTKAKTFAGYAAVEDAGELVIFVFLLEEEIPYAALKDLLKMVFKWHSIYEIGKGIYELLEDHTVDWELLGKYLMKLLKKIFPDPLDDICLPDKDDEGERRRRAWSPHRRDSPDQWTSWEVDVQFNVTMVADATIGLAGLFKGSADDPYGVMSGPTWHAKLEFEFGWDYQQQETRPVLHFTDVGFCPGPLFQHVLDLMKPLDHVLKSLNQIFGPDGFLLQKVPEAGFLLGDPDMTRIEFAQKIYDDFCDGDCEYLNIGV